MIFISNLRLFLTKTCMALNFVIKSFYILDLYFINSANIYFLKIKVNRL